MRNEVQSRVLAPYNTGSADEHLLSFTRPELVERRVWRNIFVVIAVGLTTSAVAASLTFTSGLMLGSALALLNYRWLQASLRAVLGAGSEKAPPGTTLKFVIRWLVVAAVGWPAYETGYFEAAGILVGLFAPAVAIMIEAVYVTFRTLASRDGER